MPTYALMKIMLIAGLLVMISLMHYMTDPHEIEYHAVHRRLYYLPLVLACFWFGIKGAAAVSISAIILYFPYAFYHWQGTFHDFDALIEAGLYVFIALTLGYLSERQKKEHLARIEAERLAAIGNVVSEIAHDMKSPLMAIGGFANQISRNLPVDSASSKKLQVITEEAGRLEKMVKEMLDFGKSLELDYSGVNLNVLLEEVLEVSKPIADKAGVSFKADLDKSLPDLNLDESKIRQVLMNLIVNAIQASAPGEKVSVTTSRSNLEEIVEITDCGCGIPEEDKDKVFEPFFSTRKGGTGLGLANVKRIVNAHGGRISFSSVKDKGTTFVMALPIKRHLSQ